MPRSAAETSADVESVTLAWVDWYNTARLHSTLGTIPPDEYEAAYYAQETGPSADEAAINEAV